MKKRSAALVAAATVYSGTFVWLISSFLIVAQDRSASQCFWELCAYLDSYLLDFGLNKQIFADWGEDGPVDDTPNSPVASAVPAERLADESGHSGLTDV